MAFPLVWRTAYNNLQRKLDEACADAEKFRKRTKEMQDEIDTLLAENRKLLNRAKDAEKESEDNEDDRDDARRLVKKLREENEQLTRKLKEYREACESYEIEIKELKK